jgi:hypothetical protein
MGIESLLSDKGSKHVACWTKEEGDYVDRRCLCF